MQTFERVSRIISDQLGIDSAFEFSARTTWEELDADSLDLVEVLMAIEEEFDISVPDEAVAAMQTMGDLVAYIDAEK